MASTEAVPHVPLVIAAPGGGMGHLVRAVGVALGLRDRGIDSLVLATSGCADTLAGLTGLRVIGIPRADWTRMAPALARRANPRHLLLDTFPFGLEGEWSGFDGMNRIWLARLLRWESYEQAVAGRWRPEDVPDTAVAIEALSPGQIAWIEHLGSRLLFLSAPLRFPARAVQTVIPPDLDRRLDSGGVRLVVHGGPPAEVRVLVDLLEKREPDRPDDSLVLIRPEPLADVPWPCFPVFPAASLFDRAAAIVTGCGYNCLAELREHSGKALLQAFPRRFDDQEARRRTFLAEAPSARAPRPGQGDSEGVGLLAALISGF